ncbi:MAG TPA: ATP-binding protein [Candidatus Coprenecus stercorigallinarum]|nr:ATP-binding protein [Candidatus Coprenecus stercorigallinarum]
MLFKRKLYDDMLRWKNVDKGATALLIEGARRVGKSTLVKDFAQNEYESYILLDFSKVSKEIKALFEDISDLNYFFLRLQVLCNVQLKERKSVIVFDEVQLLPLARQAIKHLVADGRYDYIETGSLISIKRHVEHIVIPSEERRVRLYPLDYEEFRWALGDTATIPLLKIAYSDRKQLGDVVNRKLMRDFRLYMLVGGMPQAVSRFIESNDMVAVDRVKRDIIQLYEDDFRKIDPSGRISMLFDAIPGELGKNTSRYQVSGVIGRGTSDEVVARFMAELEASMTVNMVYHANDPGAGMSLNKDIARYKMYLADTGLFVTLAFKDKDFTENIIYRKLLSDKLDANLGHVYENIVAQMLKAAGHELYYYTFPTESGKHNYEIDFLISDKDKISPIEVKSSGYKTHTSLDVFCRKFSKRIRNKYLIYTKDLYKDRDVLYLPAYMTMLL